MIRTALSLVNKLLQPPSRLPKFAAVALLAIAQFSATAHAYVLNGKSWTTGSNIVMQLSLGSPSSPLTDGSASWNIAVLPVISVWNSKIQRVQLSAVMDSTSPVNSGDRVNSVAFANNVFGQAFGSSTLAVTYYIMQGSNMVEADVLFNRAQTFDSYRGNLKFGSNGYAIADIRRVFLHELGHGIGLQHQDGDNIMAPVTSNREVLSDDDVAGAQAMYGAPAATPSPTPTPTATPTPSYSTRLTNISTRMKVGLGNDVLIGGFIINGTQPKKMLLRATGPSLAAAGVSGAMLDPVLELHDSAGAVLAQNDNWQTGLQAGEISASGLAPSNASESALIATLQPGSYTAILRGQNNTQGVALVEGYELDSGSSKLANLSTRGNIGVGDNVLIGGIIVQGSDSKKVMVRALGPSLASLINGALADPALEMYNSSGQLIASNDNWSLSAQVNEIVGTNLSPSNPLESAIVTTLSPGSYTAIVRGSNGQTGIGLVEVYDLQ